MNILVTFGTRPQLIKLAPVIKRLKNHRVICCSTGQHRQMLKPLIQYFDINVAIDLDVMKRNQSLSDLSIKILKEAQKALEVCIQQQGGLDLVIVQGDTTTAAMFALRAFYKKIKIAHIQAGLRTFDKYNPYPQQANRKIITRVSDYNFAPTYVQINNLKRQGVNNQVTGNTVVDAIQYVIDKDNIQIQNSQWILVTVHRRQSFGKPLNDICDAIKQLAKNGMKFIWPVHPNPNVKKVVFDKLKNQINIALCQPMQYPQLVKIMRHCRFVITDSGGIQQQAPSLKKYAFVLRQKTQRMQSVSQGYSQLIGTDKKYIVQKISAFNPVNKKIYHNPYGDGRASQKIARFIDEIV